MKPGKSEGAGCPVATPRSDGVELDLQRLCGDWSLKVDTSFARELERELILWRSVAATQSCAVERLTAALQRHIAACANCSGSGSFKVGTSDGKGATQVCLPCREALLALGNKRCWRSATKKLTPMRARR